MFTVRFEGVAAKLFTFNAFANADDSLVSEAMLTLVVRSGICVMFCWSERLYVAFTCWFSTVIATLDAEAGTASTDAAIRNRMIMAA